MLPDADIAATPKSEFLNWESASVQLTTLSTGTGSTQASSKTSFQGAGMLALTKQDLSIPGKLLKGGHTALSVPAQHWRSSSLSPAYCLHTQDFSDCREGSMRRPRVLRL